MSKCAMCGKRFQTEKEGTRNYIAENKQICETCNIEIEAFLDSDNQAVIEQATHYICACQRKSVDAKVVSFLDELLKNTPSTIDEIEEQGKHIWKAESDCSTTEIDCLQQKENEAVKAAKLAELKALTAKIVAAKAATAKTTAVPNEMTVTSGEVSANGGLIDGKGAKSKNVFVKKIVIAVSIVGILFITLSRFIHINIDALMESVPTNVEQITSNNNDLSESKANPHVGDIIEIQNGLVLISKDGFYGYTDLDGNIVINPVYTPPHKGPDYSVDRDGGYKFDGRYVMVYDGRNRLILDRNGNVADFGWGEYTQEMNYSNGVARLERMEQSFDTGKIEKVAYYRYDGTAIIPWTDHFPKAVSYYQFHNDMLLFPDEDVDYIYNVDGERKKLYVANYQQTANLLGIEPDIIKNADVYMSYVKDQETIENGTACSVSLWNSITGKQIEFISAYVTKDGSVYCNTKKNDINVEPLSDGMAFYGDKWGSYSDRNKIDAQYVNYQFETVFKISDNESLWKAMNLENIRYVRFETGMFHDGYVVASMEREFLDQSGFDLYYFVLDKTGALAFPPRSDIEWEKAPGKSDLLNDSGAEYSTHYESGLCPAKQRSTGLWGYIDLQGEWVIEPIYTWASNFSSGHAIVRQKYSQSYSKKHLIDKTGSIIFSTEDP